MRGSCGFREEVGKERWGFSDMGKGEGDRRNGLESVSGERGQSVRRGYQGETGIKVDIG